MDSEDESRQSAVGRAPHPWGIAQTRHRHRRDQCRQIYGANRKPPSQTWRTFLENHIKTLASVDFFTVATVRFQVLYVFLVLVHDRRRILHFAVTAHPTAEWTAQQLREAFP